MHLKIITHDKIVFDNEVDEIYTKGVDGEFGILKGHTPIVSALDIGVTRVVKEGKYSHFTTMGGVFQFKENAATILTDSAELGSDIDVTRAKAAKERAEARIAEHDTSIDIKRAEASLSRAIARLKVSLASKS